MKANELRIGSMIEAGIVDGIHPNGVIEVINKNGARELLHHLTLENGIPLTEEWLLKFGFEETDFTDDFHELVYIKGRTRVAKIHIGQWVYYPEALYGTTVNTDFVHQLQNAYFVFEERELELTPKVF